MADTNLSKRQEAVYNYLKKVMSRSFPPTVREICEATGTPHFRCLRKRDIL